MAVLHEATLTPTKLELLQAWVPRQEWYPSDEPDFEIVARFRFDDPDGEVGLETLILGRGDGSLFHVPLTYRGAPAADAALISTMHHSVLGERWVYDAFTDPVYRTAVASAIRDGGHEVEQIVHKADGTQAPISTGTSAWGEPGTEIGPGEVEILRVVTPFDSSTAASTPRLLAAWEPHNQPVLLAHLH